MRRISLVFLVSLLAVPISGCVQSDEDYFDSAAESGMTQEKRDRQSRRSAYGTYDFQREQEEAWRDRY
ncbi:hypothetical protein JL100_013105 [Skermanella mucosa]|uniref:hypothetical protein n=1 Tax=Skermanella mucosa TaxID=1789672 RepID=UPI00192BA6C8|nr:hypothetical protein [Skermanella mucosa]UEM23628.1 hypothetical protein JL100_013105 [Skermanella mucosa]